MLMLIFCLYWVAQQWENRVNCRDILCWTICSETMMCVSYSDNKTKSGGNIINIRHDRTFND